MRVYEHAFAECTRYAGSCWEREQESQHDIPRRSPREGVWTAAISHLAVECTLMYRASVVLNGLSVLRSVCMFFSVCVCVISEDWLEKGSRWRPVRVIPRIINGCRCFRPSLRLTIPKVMRYERAYACVLYHICILRMCLCCNVRVSLKDSFGSERDQD